MAAAVKLAASNIAWSRADDEAAAALLAGAGVDGVEIAPTMVVEHPADAADAVWTEYRSFWEHRGFRVVAMQALLFGQPGLSIFGDDALRRRTLDYLRRIIRIGGLLGAGPLVFGSPAQRRRGNLPPDDALRAAVDFFRQAADDAADAGCTLCIEPNPLAYGCDFVTTAAEAREIVERVDHPGFGLHLDSACLALAGEPPAGTLEPCAARLRHFHASEPFLAPLGSGAVNHAAAAAALRAGGYAGRVSLEMKRPADDTPDAPLDALRRALVTLREAYGE